MNTPPQSAQSTKSEQVTRSTSPVHGSEQTPRPINLKPLSESQTTTQSLSPAAREYEPRSTHHSVLLSQIIVEDDYNGRLSIDPDKVMTLQISIAQTGLLNPITLYMKNNKHVLIAGRHRLAAARALGWREIAAIYIDATDDEAAVLRLAENSNRAQLSPVEEAKQLSHLVEIDPKAVDGVSEKIGRSVNWILDRLEIIEWSEALMDHVHNKRIALGTAKLLARIADPQLREIRIRQAAQHGINARTARLWLDDSNSTNYEDCELSEKSVDLPFPSINMEILVSCFVCEEKVKIENTTSERFCGPCLQNIRLAINKG